MYTVVVVWFGQRASQVFPDFAGAWGYALNNEAAILVRRSTAGEITLNQIF
jgi:hypothetical protein